jgi:hypothetical protein
MVPIIIIFVLQLPPLRRLTTRYNEIVITGGIHSTASILTTMIAVVILDIMITAVILDIFF